MKPLVIVVGVLAPCALLAACGGGRPSPPTSSSASSPSIGAPAATSSGQRRADHAPEEPSGMNFRMPGARPTSSDQAAALRAAELPPEALAKLRASCHSTTPSSDGATACSMLGALHAEGLLGFARDPEEARRLHDRSMKHWLGACDVGDVHACATSGWLNALKLRTLDPGSTSAKEWAAATIPLLEKACRSGAKNSCGHLSEIYEVGRGVGRDAVKATLYRTQEGSPPAP